MSNRSLIEKPLPGRISGPSTRSSLGRGLVGAWLFNERGGQRVFDYSGCEHHGVFTGGGASRAKWLPEGYLFDTTGAYLDCGNKAPLSFTQGTLFVRLAGVPDNLGAIVSKADWNADRDGYVLSYYNGTWWTELDDASGSSATRFNVFGGSGDTSRFNARNWIDLAYGFSAAGGIFLAENGLLVPVAVGGSYRQPVSNVHPFTIGGNPTYSQIPGITVHTVYAWNRPLTPPELRILSADLYAPLARARRVFFKAIAGGGQQDLGGAITGVATASASAVITGGLAGTVTGAASAVGGVEVIRGLAGDCPGAGSSSADVRVTRGLICNVTGAMTLAADGNVIRGLVSDLAGAAVVAANVAVSASLSANITGSASAQAGFGSTVPLSAAITGSSVASAEAIVSRPLSASVTGAATASANAGVTTNLAASLAGVATAGATANLTSGLAALVTGASGASATGNVTLGLYGSITGVASASASFGGGTALSASVSGSGSSTASPAVAWAVSGAISGAASVTAKLDAHFALAARVTGNGSAAVEPRPLFNFPVDWSTTPVQSFAYELNALTIGAAAPVFEPLQTFTTRGFSFSLLLPDEAAIHAFDTFTAQLQGRLNGFWMPSPFAHLEIDQVQDEDRFSVAGHGVGLHFPDDVSRLLAFRATDGTLTTARVLSPVNLQDDGRTYFTLNARVNGLSAEFEVFLLLYVRLAADDENAEFLADNFQRRSVRVVELPAEYEAIETGRVPVFLYTLSTGNQTYTFTGLNEGITSQGNAFAPAPITHSGPKLSLAGKDDDLTITTVFGMEPFARLAPFVQASPLSVRVAETLYGTPDIVTDVFDGVVDSVQAAGRKLQVRCVSRLAAAGRKFPRLLLQPRCNYFVFSAPCGLDREDFTVAATVVSITGNQIVVSLAGDPPLAGKPESALANYWALGVVEGAGGSPVLLVVASSALAAGRITLTLNLPPVDLAVDDTVAVSPGCDGHRLTCKAYDASTNPRGKFNNFTRWGGQVIPLTNPSIRGVQVQTAAGTKK